MAVTTTWSNHAKYQLMKKQLDLVNDDLRIYLMRDDFVFSKDDHAQLKNIKAVSGVVSITFEADDQTITRITGSFITDGFVAGNQITTSATLNPGPFIISTVLALVITCVPASGIVDEGPVSKTITADDELATGNGYSQGIKELTTQAVTEDDANDRGEFTCDYVLWTASGGTIGPSQNALIVDVTDTDNTIIACIAFGEDKSATDGLPFDIGNIKLQLT